MQVSRRSRILQEFGFGLAFAVLVNALIIRSLLVPAIMHRIGPANWAMPAWPDRIVPNLSIETPDEPDDPDGALVDGEPTAVPPSRDEHKGDRGHRRERERS